MTLLSVNLNKVALMRNARGGGRPDVAALGEVCLHAGAAGLTLHPRPDGRHARADDVRDLARLTAAHGRELNVEGNPFEGPAQHGGYAFPGFMALVRETRPAQVTMVPDAAAQQTSDHGWDLARDAGRLAPLVREAQELGCRVSLFVDADADAVVRAAAVGADRVELYTGPYAWAAAEGAADRLLDGYRSAARAAHDAGIGVNAGHDLDLDNLPPFLDAVPGVLEVSIGQALVSDALEMGLAATVRAYLNILTEAAARIDMPGAVR
jgi:pyridoxine 5-phosphate synthase